MSHNFLFGTYAYIAKRRQIIEKQMTADPDSLQTTELQARINVLDELQQYLFTHYHHKLPKRLQKQALQVYHPAK